MLRLERRPEPARGMVYVSPVIAVALTVLSSMAMFAFMGVDPVRAIAAFFIEPLSTLDGFA
ncbi:MAG: ABC transporter permease, partial [Rhodospirillaceae bacterium]